MNHPTVYDARQTQVLRVGSPVERRFPDGTTGHIVGSVLGLTKRGVFVKWPAGSCRSYKPVRHSLLRRNYRCPDLILITPEEKGDGDGTGS